MSEQAPPVLRLARGTRQAVAVTAGTIILVRRGRITLREPLAWLAESCLRAEHHLTAEATYTVTTRGWAEIVALDSAEVALIAGHGSPEAPIPVAIPHQARRQAWARFLTSVPRLRRWRRHFHL